MRQHWSQRTATQQVHMDVVNLLSAVAVGVHDQTIAIFGNTFLLSNFCRYGDHASQRLLMLSRHVVHSWNEDIWNDQNMRWRLRRNIAKRRYQIILVDDIGGDLTTNNFAEYSFFCHDIFLFQIAMRCAMLRRATLRV